jgi:hypothetical protein
MVSHKLMSKLHLLKLFAKLARLALSQLDKDLSQAIKYLKNLEECIDLIICFLRVYGDL